MQFEAHASVAGREGDAAEAAMDIIVNVLDANDERPRFIEETFVGQVPENAPNGTATYFTNQCFLR